MRMPSVHQSTGLPWQGVQSWCFSDFRALSNKKKPDHLDPQAVHVAPVCLFYTRVRSCWIQPCWKPSRHGPCSTGLQARCIPQHHRVQWQLEATENVGNLIDLHISNSEAQLTARFIIYNYMLCGILPDCVYMHDCIPWHFVLCLGRFWD